MFCQAVFPIKTNKRFESLNLLRLNIMVKFICHGNLGDSFCIFTSLIYTTSLSTKNEVLYNEFRTIVINIIIFITALCSGLENIYQCSLRTICYWQLHCIICYYHFTLQVDVLLYLQFHLVNRKIQYILSQNGLTWKNYRHSDVFKRPHLHRLIRLRIHWWFSKQCQLQLMHLC